MSSKSSMTGQSPTSTLSGLTNTPDLGSPSFPQYLFPPAKLPSLRPTGSSNFTPIHFPAPPGISSTSPMYMTTPLFVSWPPTRHLLPTSMPVSYTHLRAHETRHDLVCRLLLEKKK